MVRVFDADRQTTSGGGKQPSGAPSGEDTSVDQTEARNAESRIALGMSDRRARTELQANSETPTAG
jgi:hypothetical protein